jgi:hypothetical protein
MVAKLLPGRVMWPSIGTLMQTWVSGRFFGGGTFLYACGRVNNPIVDGAEAIGTFLFSTGRRNATVISRQNGLRSNLIALIPLHSVPLSCFYPISRILLP